jgi:signal transduction histidine kinase
MTDTREQSDRLAAAASTFLIVAGLTIVAGWQFRIPVLRGQAFGTFVAPNTALCFVLTGSSILLQMSLKRKWNEVGVFLAAFVTLFAFATGLEYIFHIELGIDRLFMSHRLSDWTLPLPGRFSVNSTLGFFVAGIGGLTLRRRSGPPWSELSGALLLLLSYLSVVGYLLGASVLYDHVMALLSAILFGVAGVALLCGASTHVLLGIALSPFAGAVASRKMIFAVVMILPILGMAQVWAERIGLVSIRLGTAVSIIASATIFTVLALRTASVLNETDRKRLDTEGALLRSTQLATAGRMAASIAHEVNNPLEAVTNIIFLLRTSEMPEDIRRQYLEIAEKELTRVSAIARRTLGFFREDAKEVEIDLREMIDGVLSVYRNKMPDGITVRKDFCESPLVRAKAGEVRQVLMNLTANALDALPENGGELGIRVSTTEEVATIEIKDNGHGIARENLNHIFEPFFTTKKDYGTGLGLWVSKELVIQNNGSIKVLSSTSEQEHGTIFQVSLPAVVRTAAATESMAEKARL